MSEVEYDLLLEAVQTAVAPAPEDDFVVQTQRSYPSPRAANDNRGPWPLVNRPKPLIIWMEATTRIELVYTVLQTVA